MSPAARPGPCRAPGARGGDRAVPQGTSATPKSLKPPLRAGPRCPLRVGGSGVTFTPSFPQRHPSTLSTPEHTVELRGATLAWATRDKSSKKHVLEVSPVTVGGTAVTVAGTAAAHRHPCVATGWWHCRRPPSSSHRWWRGHTGLGGSGDCVPGLGAKGHAASPCPMSPRDVPTPGGGFPLGLCAGRRFPAPSANSWGHRCDELGAVLSHNLAPKTTGVVTKRRQHHGPACPCLSPTDPATVPAAADAGRLRVPPPARHGADRHRLAQGHRRQHRQDGERLPPPPCHPGDGHRGFTLSLPQGTDVPGREDAENGAEFGSREKLGGGEDKRAGEGGHPGAGTGTGVAQGWTWGRHSAGHRGDTVTGTVVAPAEPYVVPSGDAGSTAVATPWCPHLLGALVTCPLSPQPPAVRATPAKSGPNCASSCRGGRRCSPCARRATSRVGAGGAEPPRGVPRVRGGWGQRGMERGQRLGGQNPTPGRTSR